MRDCDRSTFPRRFALDPGSKMMAEPDPIFFIISCGNVRKEKAKEEATDPLSITHNDVTFAHPAGIR